MAAMALTEMAGGSGCPPPFKPEAFRSSLRKELLEHQEMATAEAGGVADTKDPCCTPAKPASAPWEGSYACMLRFWCDCGFSVPCRPQCGSSSAAVACLMPFLTVHNLALSPLLVFCRPSIIVIAGTW
jgi:hypothetical protein